MRSKLVTIFVLVAILLSPLAFVRPAMAANPGDMVINEIHADPDATLAGDANGDGIRDATDDEFVEIYNDSGGDLDLSGWTLSDGFGVRHVFPSGSVVMADCSVVIFGGPTITGTFGGSLTQTASTGSLGLNNGGDMITLNDGATDIAVESYGSEGGDNQALTRNPDITGAFVKHSMATGSGGALWSPGTKIDGSMFSGCSLPALTGVGSADPVLLSTGETTLLTVSVTPGTVPPSTGLTVEGDLTDIGGVASQSFFDDGTNGDVTAGDNVFSFTAIVASTTIPGSKSLPISISDDQGRIGATSITLAVIQSLTIMQIQGDGRYSAFDGDTVNTTGVVTLFTANGNHCWLQDPEGDGNPATSDGIFVSGCAFAGEGPVPAVGDLIRIIAGIDEQQFGNALPLTRLINVLFIEVLSSGNPLPSPVELGSQPNESMPEGEMYWEPLEGMLVSVENAPVVAATSSFGEFTILTKDLAVPDSGFFPEQQQILLRNLSQDPNSVDYNPERVLVDDSTVDNPIIVMPGDRMRSLVGVVDYTFGNYKLQPASFDVKLHDLPNFPASTRSGPNGNAVITTFNVENLFDLVLNTPTPVDVIGEIGFDPGSSWGPPSTQNNTLRRKPTVCQGDPNGFDPFDPSVEWDGFGQDNIDDLGVHTETCGTAIGLFISEYVEGSSNNKAVEIYNGTGFAVNLAAGGYAVDIYFNGSSSAGTTIQLAGTVAPGDVFVLADDNASPAILAIADQVSNRSFFNGDDAVVLRKGGKDDAGSTPTPEQLETQLTKLAMAIEYELRLPDIIVVQEIENQDIAQELGDRVNAAAGTNYIATSFETSDGRGIEAGFLWDANRVALLDAFQMVGPDVEMWFGPSSPSPGREPIVGVFEINGQEVTIIGNHFKSKGGDDPLYGVNWPPFRVTEIQRKGQARVVRDFVNGILDADPDALVMVAGDLNDFQFGEPGENDIGDEPGHPLSILESGGAVPLTNLLYWERPPESFTFVFDGNSQVLDHMLVSPALLNYVVAADILHFNAGFADVLGGDAGTTLRASDHDPLEGRFNIE